MARRAHLAVFLFLVFPIVPALAGEGIEMDVIRTSAGDLKMSFVGHGTLMFEFDDTVIHVDPWSRLADYATLPKADLVLITHEHPDHLDPGAIEAVRTEGTEILANRGSADRVPGSRVLANGESATVKGVGIRAVPAYNRVHMRQPGVPYHPKGGGNGYVLTFGDTRVYVAGDTEDIPEMDDLSDIRVAFLPMNLPYTMTPEMTAKAARAVQPKILYPYHFGETDPKALAALLEGSGIEVRIRDLQ